ncbi:hypothetical protein [Calderihabitans maritimus]|uniref:Uncharacterized protein n=1 Tax=Calderihabitans maritimus TaxID=1246530 RepID=A0A1Z5HQJ1_9FIRM|nr:hypothetical protein [Calderihabitans maritimus]GAW91637.1 hypothetical protein KKC1_07980 [Calderihabitans maritimus]
MRYWSDFNHLPRHRTHLKRSSLFDWPYQWRKDMSTTRKDDKKLNVPTVRSASGKLETSAPVVKKESLTRVAPERQKKERREKGKTLTWRFPEK